MRIYVGGGILLTLLKPLDKEGVMGDQNVVGIEPAQVEEVAAWVAKCEGAIVSQVLLKTTQGSVTLFASDAGRSLNEHTAPFGDDALHREMRVGFRTPGGRPRGVGCSSRPDHRWSA